MKSRSYVKHIKDAGLDVFFLDPLDLKIRAHKPVWPSQYFRLAYGVSNSPAAAMTICRVLFFQMKIVTLMQESVVQRYTPHT